MILLSDHDIEGYVRRLWAQLEADGWVELLATRLVTFKDIDLPVESTDRTVWRFAQANGMLLVTGNRNMDEIDSLERTIRDENHAGALPVLTVASVERLDDPRYRERCATRVAEIALYVDNYRGVGRIFIP